MTIRVILADDHQIVRQGLRALINSAGDCEVVGEAEDGRQAIEFCRQLQPDVLVLDIVMPRLNGMEALRQLHQCCPNTKVIILSSYEEEMLLFRCMQWGAAGYLLKHSAAADLIQAIRTVVTGKNVFTASIARRLKAMSNEAALRGRPMLGKALLTAREAEVLQLIAEGFPNKQIASELGISIKTVEKHRQQIMNKLNIHEVAGLTRYAVRERMVGAGAFGASGGQASRLVSPDRSGLTRAR